MKRGALLSIFLVSFASMLASENVHAEMDRWEALAMRDRYAEKHPETLNRPAAEAVVPGIEPETKKSDRSPTPSASIKPVQESHGTKFSTEVSSEKYSATATMRAPAPVPAAVKPAGPGGKLAPTVENLRLAAHQLATKKLSYVFGADEVESGGLDCSSTVQYLLSERLGIKGVPRTSYLQYEWLAKKGTLNKLSGKRASDKLLRKLSPGDLIFWGKTWSSGHKVSHVMIYMGWNPQTKKHFVFGARGKKVKGLTGAGVDVFELNPDRGVLVGHGHVPGLR